MIISIFETCTSTCPVLILGLTVSASRLVTTPWTSTIYSDLTVSAIFNASCEKSGLKTICTLPPLSLKSDAN